MDLVVADDSRVGTVWFLILAADVRRQVTLPWMSLGCDAASLAPVLEEYCQPFPGFHLYFPRRRNRPAARRARIDYVRRKMRG